MYFAPTFVISETFSWKTLRIDLERIWRTGPRRRIEEIHRAARQTFAVQLSVRADMLGKLVLFDCCTRGERDGDRSRLLRYFPLRILFVAPRFQDMASDDDDDDDQSI